MNEELSPHLPPLPKRAKLPKERPEITDVSAENAQPSRLLESLEILQVLNRAPQVEVHGEAESSSIAELLPPAREERLNPRLFSKTLVVMTLLFLACASLAFFWTSEEFKNLTAATNATNKRRDLKETPSLSDPSSPTTETPKPSDPYPALKPPTSPTRN